MTCELRKTADGSWTLCTAHRMAWPSTETVQCPCDSLGADQAIKQEIVKWLEEIVARLKANSSW